MLSGYVIAVMSSPGIMLTPDVQVDIVGLINLSAICFQLTTDLVIEIWCTRREISEGHKIPKCELARRFAIATISKSVFFGVNFVVTFFLGAFYNSRLKQFSAIIGDIKQEVPPTNIWFS